MSGVGATRHDAPLHGDEPGIYYLQDRANPWSDWHRASSLILHLTRRHLAARYRGSALGFMWSLLNPLMMMAVYTFVFVVLFPQRIPGVPYPVFILSGLLTWNFFSVGSQNAAVAIIDQATLIQKSYFPRAVLPVSAVLSNMVNYLAIVPLLMLLAASFGVGPTWKLALLPLLLALLLMLTLGFGMLLAAIVPFARDVLQVLEVVFQIWFFATPIVYHISKVEDTLRGWHNGAGFILYRMNPLVGAVRLAQGVFLGQPVMWKEMAMSFFGAVVLMGAGWWVFRRLEPRFADAK